MLKIKIFDDTKELLIVWCRSAEKLLEVTTTLKDPYKFKVEYGRFNSMADACMDGIWCLDCEKLKKIFSPK